MNPVEKLTNQSFFDIVWERARDKRRAKDCYGACRYRGDDGLACFVGAAIPDELYERRFDHDAVGGRLMKDIDIVGEAVATRFADVDEDLIAECQSAHDIFPHSEWDARLRRLASRFNLKVPA